MSRPLERGALLCGVLVLLLSLQFGAALAGGPVALPLALLFSAGATWLWLWLEVPLGGVWVPPLVCALLCGVTAGVSYLAFRPDFAGLFTFVPAAAGSALTLYAVRRSQARCGLCNHRLPSGSLVFTCPRCSLHVCEERCWSFEHRRCQLCLEQRVHLLPTDERWWMSVAGPRSRHDRCQMCRGAADQVDLRLCPKCRRAQCRDCWDHNNGECARCGTALPDLPASLRETVASVAAQR